MARRRTWALGAGAVLTAAVGGAMLAARPFTGEAPSPVAAPAAAAPRVDQRWIPAAEATLGGDADPTDAPARRVHIGGFWMDRTEVTNAQFAAFVRATGYRTVAERAPRPEDNPGVPAALLVPGSAVFSAPAAVDNMDDVAQWWRFTPGADWRRPEGPGSGLAGRWEHPVVHVAWEDAAAYARWRGGRLPTEDEWERAAGAELPPAERVRRANTWQGAFPVLDAGTDGHKGAAPVAGYAPNALGLHDMLGNVWEWTATPHPAGAARVIKGGSFLCSEHFCARYRPAARQLGDPALGASHIGFRTVHDGASPTEG